MVSIIVQNGCQESPKGELHTVVVVVAVSEERIVSVMRFKDPRLNTTHYRSVRLVVGFSWAHIPALKPEKGKARQVHLCRTCQTLIVQCALQKQTPITVNRRRYKQKQYKTKARTSYWTGQHLPLQSLLHVSTTAAIPRHLPVPERGNTPEFSWRPLYTGYVTEALQNSKLHLP